MQNFNNKYLNQIDDIGTFITKVGLKIERNPTDWDEYYNNDLLRGLTLLEVPEPYNSMPNCDGLFGKEPVAYPTQLALAERVSRYDSGCVLCLPTPSMVGHAINVLGNEQQKHAFFSRYYDKPKRSFFAVTEPGVGTDATAGSSYYEDKNGRLVLNAHKKLVGGGAQADFGLVFVRQGQEGQNHKLVVCDAERIKDLDIKRLQMHGLVAADLSEIIADHVEIRKDEILGHGVNVGLRDGFFAISQVFERYRPSVSAMAIGNARGILDSMHHIGVRPDLLEPYYIRHQAFLDRLEATANSYMGGGLKQHDTSQLKLAAISFSDSVVSFAFGHLPSQDLFSMPELLKKCRDAKAYEYMEGTSHIHSLQSFPCFTTKRA